MEKVVMSPDSLIITLVHGDNPNSKFGKTLIARFSELDKTLAQRGKEKMAEIVPPIIVVKSPDGKLFIYKGNIEVHHARKNGYNVTAVILTSQIDLNQYQSSSLWYDIGNLEELLEVLRIYADYPKLDIQTEYMPKPLQDFITEKRMAFEQRGMARAFGWDDDE